MLDDGIAGDTRSARRCEPYAFAYLFVAGRTPNLEILHFLVDLLQWLRLYNED
jgi:hypothetical protein